jgi:beta-glucosidase-like glycosyl hydrolase
MEMNAITEHYVAAESGVLAALAGHDVIFFSHTRDYQQAVFDALRAAAESGRLSIEHVEAANQRIAAMIERYPVEPRPALSTIRSQEHLSIMRKAAEASMTVHNPDSDIFPLRLDGTQQIALIEFASYLDTAAMDSGRLSSLAALVQSAAPKMAICSLPVGDWDETLRDSARQLARESHVLVLATRNAHLWAEELDFARELLGLSLRTILICLSNPYDADALPGADTVLYTFGGSEPSLQAAVDALLGHVQPDGHLPV